MSTTHVSSLLLVFLCANARQASDLEKLLLQNGVKSLIEAADLDNANDRETLLLSRNVEPEARSEEQPLFPTAISFDAYNRYKIMAQNN